MLIGELTGNVLALDAADGRVLAHLPVGGQLGVGIVTHQVNGRQYIAAASATPFRLLGQSAGGSPGLTVFGLPGKP